MQPVVVNVFGKTLKPLGSRVIQEGVFSVEPKAYVLQSESLLL